MRLTEFWTRMEARFGSAYAHSVAADYRVPALGATIEQAFARGDDPKEVWRAVVAEFEIPPALQ